MTFLKKLGAIVLKGTQIVLGFAPMAQQVASGNQTATNVVNDLVSIAGIVGQVEVMGQALGLPGAQKLTAAAPAVAQIVLQSSLMVHREIADPVKFQAACATIASGVADLLNSLKGEIETVNKA